CKRPASVAASEGPRRRCPAPTSPQHIRYAPRQHAMGWDLLIVVALLTCNGVFAGAEIAILSVRKPRLAEFIRRRDKRALAVKSLRDNPERFLSTVQVCITTAGTAAAALGGARLEHDLLPHFQAIGLGTVTAIAVV